MSRMVIVPNELSAAINAKLDAALADCPEAAKDREYMFQQLLEAYDDLGYIPDFKVERNEKQ